MYIDVFVSVGYGLRAIGYRVKVMSVWNRNVPQINNPNARSDNRVVTIVVQCFTVNERIFEIAT